ncbi:hypothetical protein GCM10027612_15630 [Microbispora bryophytorum subsp. camponoti]
MTSANAPSRAPPSTRRAAASETEVAEARVPTVPAVPHRTAAATTASGPDLEFMGRLSDN